MDHLGGKNCWNSAIEYCTYLLPDNWSSGDVSFVGLPKLESQEDRSTRSSRHTPEQVPLGLRQAEEGNPVAEFCRKMDIS